MHILAAELCTFCLPNRTYGYSRNHRPDLKQFNYGLVVNGEGIPLLGHASDGNESDKVWNRRVIEELVEQSSDISPI